MEEVEAGDMAQYLTHRHLADRWWADQTDERWSLDRSTHHRPIIS
jgi:hypothetical protein